MPSSPNPQDQDKPSQAPLTTAGWVQDSKGAWHQYAHSSNNLTRAQFRNCTTAWLASKEPESTWHHIWRRFIRGQEWGTLMENEQYEAKTALYKRHRGILKASKDFANFERKMMRNRHIDYKPLGRGILTGQDGDYDDVDDAAASWKKDEDGGDGYRAPAKKPSSSSSSSQDPKGEAKDEAPPPAYPPHTLGVVGLTGEKEIKSAHRNATLHDLDAASRAAEDDGRRVEERGERDDEAAIPPGW